LWGLQIAVADGIRRYGTQSDLPVNSLHTGSQEIMGCRVKTFHHRISNLPLSAQSSVPDEFLDMVRLRLSQEAAKLTPRRKKRPGS
jgi:AICAR transformylase/IMP cyclohydrolase PurH